MTTREKKYFSKYKEALVDVPNLVENQIASFEAFMNGGLQDAIMEFSPIADYSEKKFELSFLGFDLEYPEFDEYHARENRETFQARLKAKVALHNKTLDSTKEEEIFLTEIPFMTPHGTFIINGIERVIVPQLARSYGVFFTVDDHPKGPFYGAKIIPGRGAWIEFESNKDGAIYVRIDKKRKFAATALLRIFGLETNEEIEKAFAGDEVALKQIKDTLAKDSSNTKEEAYADVYRRIRDGEVASADALVEYFEAVFGDTLYDLSEVGRYHFNKRFDKELPKKEGVYDQVLSADDLVTIMTKISHLNVDPHAQADDIDHLGSRRVRFVGELLEQKVRQALSQMKRNIKDRMSTVDNDTSSAINLVNQRPFQARVKEFFATSQLSQYMDQENALSEISHLRTLSALGPGGLTRERAGFEVRDVHPSHYGRVCPIHTPEGQNIGLILRMSVYARINNFGMIEAPYAKVSKGKVTGEIVYLNAMDEEKYNIAHASNPYDKNGKFVNDIVEARLKTRPGICNKDEVDFIDVATNAAFSVATSLIPFLEADDANRSLMGSNMMKQAVPLIVPQAPLVGTGMEGKAALDTGRVVISRGSGTVIESDGKHIVVKDSKGNKESYNLINFIRTNSNSFFHQRAIVTVGDKVKKGQVLADTSTTEGGQLAIGQNVLVAFMCWNGQNFEDAIILSEKLVKNSIFTSIRIDEYECVIRDTKLGEEQTTTDIPNVGEAKLANLDEDGIVRVGAYVGENDILVGKVTPKGETELTPEEKLLRSIFGEKSRDVKDTSLRLGYGKKGRIIGVKVFSREHGHKLESGVLKKVYIEVAQLRNIKVGDKLAGRHGNKGVISIILPEEDMPYMEDGTPVDVILTPLGIPSRMNLGQILEMHLGLAANTLGYQAVVPPFAGATADEIAAELEEAGFSGSGKVTLYDGRTGQKFDQDVAVGYMYILKLHHMIDDKMHARSIGPYSLITQQPLGGKAQSGGQRFGEMEVWALEGYGAAHTLREMLTIKSDDVTGRSAAFDSIIKGQKIREQNTPASFDVLTNYLRGLALDVNLEVIKNNELIDIADDAVVEADVTED
ncbi:MAG: DNA-directed RNA polymerase subunit beta [Candidatus Pacebacteria bacterium]|nr:DNA-directed RNA polymerase subunit beta [Candidatus Paceibacterota bacterium]